MSLLILYYGYRSKLAKKISFLLPKPPAQWKPGILVPYGFFLCFLGFTGYFYFINQSGGPLEFFSAPRGKGAYEESTAYLYGARWLLSPALVILLVEIQRRKFQPFLRIVIWGMVILYFLYQIFIGQRYGVFSVGITLFAAIMLPGNKFQKLKIQKVLFYWFMVSLLVGFVALFRREFYLGSGYQNLKVFFSKPIYNQLIDLLIEGILKGGTGESFEGSEIAMYMIYLKIIPQYVDYDYGKFYLQVLFHWIPRILWKEKPDLRLEKKYEIENIIGTSHISGPSVTMLGMCNLHFGLVGIIIGVYLTGIILGVLENWRKNNPHNYGILLIYIMFFASGLGAVVGNGIFAALPDLLLWNLLPILGAFVFIKMKT